MLGCARAGIIFSSLFSSLGYDELAVRLNNARPRGILTHPDLAERIPADMPGSPALLFITEEPTPSRFNKEVLVHEAVEQMPTEFPTVWLPADTPLYLNYTSGSTGPSQGGGSCPPGQGRHEIHG